VVAVGKLAARINEAGGDNDINLQKYQDAPHMVALIWHRFFAVARAHAPHCVSAALAVSHKRFASAANNASCARQNNGAWRGVTASHGIVGGGIVAAVAILSVRGMAVH